MISALFEKKAYELRNLALFVVQIEIMSLLPSIGLFGGNRLRRQSCDRIRYTNLVLQTEKFKIF